MGDKKVEYRLLLESSETKRPRLDGKRCLNGSPKCFMEVKYPVELNQNGDWWKTFVKAVKFLVPKNVEHFLTSL